MLGLFASSLATPRPDTGRCSLEKTEPDTPGYGVADHFIQMDHLQATNYGVKGCSFQLGGDDKFLSNLTTVYDFNGWCGPGACKLTSPQSVYCQCACPAPGVTPSCEFKLKAAVNASGDGKSLACQCN
mmetsp:Transcript_63016/g.140344  ORF Transcript_63016/g.140344 Transcript_63016/m.140344 type:complete len:128 (-) Transcript_63016:447-830(-)